MSTLKVPDLSSSNSYDTVEIQGVVLVDAITGIPMSASNPLKVTSVGTIKDLTGVYFDLESCSITYTRDSNGNIITETAVDGAFSWVKTYTWVAGVLTAESKWVKQ